MTEITSATNADKKTYNTKNKVRKYAQKKGRSSRSNVAVLGKTHECVGSYSSSSKRYSEQMAAMKAMEYFNSLSDDNSTATFASHFVFPAVSMKGDEEKPSLGTNDVKDNTISEISFTDTSVFSAKLPSGVTELPQQISSLETAKPPIITTESDNPDRKLMSTPKTNYKSALQEYLQKKNLGQAVYVSTPDPTTNKFVSKVFVGKTYNARSKLNEYVQKRRAKPPHYETVSDNSKGFRSKVTVLGKTFECVGSYSTKQTSAQMAAMVAMDYFNSQSVDNSAGKSVPPLGSEKPGEDNASSGDNEKEDKTISEIPSSDTSVFSDELLLELAELRLEQSSYADTANLQMKPQCPAQKTQTNYESVLNRQDPTTAERTCKEKNLNFKEKGGKYIGATNNAKSKLNEYAQKRGAKPPYYEEVPVSDNSVGFRSKVTVFGKTFECVGSYSTKQTSAQMAAMEAMDYFNSQSVDNSAARSVQHSVFPLGSKKNDEDNESPRTSEKEDNTTSAISSSMWIPKTQLNHKSSLHEYLHKSKLGQAVYESTKDPTTNMYSSKVFVRNRCFMGNAQKSRKEAERHVAEVALKILEGRSRTPDCNFQKVLKEYHTNIGFPTFPKYKEASCVDDGRFIVEVKVKKKYQFVCEDVKPRKKDVEVWLAEQAVKILEGEKKISLVQGNAKSRLNIFLQSQGGASEYNIQGDQAKFSGSLLFYAVDIYESLAPQKTKEEANIFAAMSACNGMDLL